MVTIQMVRNGRIVQRENIFQSRAGRWVGVVYIFAHELNVHCNSGVSAPRRFGEV